MPKIQLTKAAAADVPPDVRRRTEWTEAAGSRAREDRAKRLKSLRHREDAIGTGRDLLRNQWEHGPRISDVFLRDALVYVRTAQPAEPTNPALSPQRKAENPGLLASTVRRRVTARPPLGQLIHRNGAAPRLLLTALAVAALRTPAGATADLSDIPNTGKGSWAKLLGDAAPPDVARRHVVDGLKRLHRMDLVRLQGPRSRPSGFSGWELLAEDSSGHRHTVVDEGLRVPLQFWTNGWIHVLTPPEVAAYFMIRTLAATYPASHTAAGVFATPTSRSQRFGVTKTAYATLNELEEFGLVRRTTPRGTGTDSEHSPREVDRFALTDAGLKKDAFTKVSSVLAEQVTPARIARYDALYGWPESMLLAKASNRASSNWQARELMSRE